MPKHIKKTKTNKTTKQPSGLESHFLKFAVTLDIGIRGTVLQLGPPGRLLKSQEGLGASGSH